LPNDVPFVDLDREPTAFIFRVDHDTIEELLDSMGFLGVEAPAGSVFCTQPVILPELVDRVSRNRNHSGSRNLPLPLYFLQLLDVNLLQFEHRP